MTSLQVLELSVSIATEYLVLNRKNLSKVFSIFFKAVVFQNVGISLIKEPNEKVKFDFEDKYTIWIKMGLGIIQKFVHI